MDNFAEIYDSKSSLMHLTDKNGVIDSYRVVDALCRNIRFDKQDAAKRLADGATHLNAALTYCENDPAHPFNQIFITSFNSALSKITRAAVDAEAKEVILPHSFERNFGSWRPQEFLDMTNASYISETMMRSGIIISFRNEPYDLDLSNIAPKASSLDILIPVDGHPETYKVVNIAALLSNEGRGLASATQRVKSIWDIESWRPKTLQANLFSEHLDLL